MRRFPNFESAEHYRDLMREAVPEPRWSVVENRDGSFSVVHSFTYSGGQFDLSPCEREHAGCRMTPQEFRAARHKLGLTLSQAAHVLGYEGTHANQQIRKMEAGEREVRNPQARLMRAYLDGYRPQDWPEKTS